MVTSNNFKHEAKRLINSICRSRKTAITKGTSEINQSWAVKRMEAIQLYLDSSNPSLKGYSKFLINHYSSLKRLAVSWEQLNKLNKLHMDAKLYQYL